MALWRPFLDQADNIKEEAQEDYYNYQGANGGWPCDAPTWKSAFSIYHPPETESQESQESTQYPGSMSSVGSQELGYLAQPASEDRAEGFLQQYHPYAHYSHALSSPSSSESCQDSPYQVPRFNAVAASDDMPHYVAFRAAMLEAIGGSHSVTNPRMRRSICRYDPADPEYEERRARNNAAAKRSRDMRKRREDELAIRMAFLEREGRELRSRVAAARAESLCGTCCTQL